MTVPIEAERSGQLDPQSLAAQSVGVLIGSPLFIAGKLPLAFGSGLRTMSLHTSMIAIHGHHLADVADVFARFQYRIIGTPASYDSVDLAWDDLMEGTGDRNKVKKLVYVDNGWTYIIDEELVLMANEDTWIHFTGLWQTRVFAWLCEGMSRTYAISVFDNGQKVRKAFSVDGELLENEGTPLTEENGVDWSSPYEDDILQIAERMGVPYGCSDVASEKYVYLLDESHMKF